MIDYNFIFEHTQMFKSNRSIILIDYLLNIDLK